MINESEWKRHAFEALTVASSWRPWYYLFKSRYCHSGSSSFSLRCALYSKKSGLMFTTVLSRGFYYRCLVCWMVGYTCGVYNKVTYTTYTIPPALTSIVGHSRREQVAHGFRCITGQSIKSSSGGTICYPAPISCIWRILLLTELYVIDYID